MLETQTNKINPIDLNIGKLLKSRRLMLGLSQKDLNKALGIGIQQILRYESATNGISISKLYNIAKFLGVTISYFFPEETNHNEPQTPNNIPETELLDLTRAFLNIKNPNARQHFIALVKMLSKQSYKANHHLY